MTTLLLSGTLVVLAAILLLRTARHWRRRRNSTYTPEEILRDYGSMAVFLEEQRRCRVYELNRQEGRPLAV